MIAYSWEAGQLTLAKAWYEQYVKLFIRNLEHEAVDLVYCIVQLEKQ